MPVFETGSFSHSDTCPTRCKLLKRRYLYNRGLPPIDASVPLGQEAPGAERITQPPAPYKLPTTREEPSHAVATAR